ncbi:MAG TPA: response regulator, partial [Flavisolibacter sp.]|nr:response regulator [Flavisolibacter sp.]
CGIFVAMAIQFILLVDDDADDQYVFKDALQNVDASIIVETAVDGIDALQKLAENKAAPQLIFLDLNMPRMNGKSFLKEIKSSQALQSIPVIVYSTSSNPADIEETKVLGAKDFIIKPNSYNELCEVLATALQ